MAKIFAEYKVTNGHVRFLESGKYTDAKEVGCTGLLSMETEMRTVTQRCEGAVKNEISVPVKLTGTLRGHIDVDILRKVFGIDTTGLKKGVYAYGKDSVPGIGAWTWDVYDLTQTDVKKIAIPLMTVTSGFKWSLENGGDEVAELEFEFSAGMDSNGRFYYEAFESEIADIKAKWHTEFEPSLVSGTPSV